MGKIIGVIPARYASTRFPAKSLANIAGKEMIRWVIEGALQSKQLSQVVVATDDSRIGEAAKQSGATVIMTESDLPSGTDRVWAAVQGLDCELVINIQGDEPLIKGTTIDLLAESMLAHPDCEMGTLAHDLMADELGSSSVVKLVVNQKNEAIYFSRLPIPYSCRKPSTDQVVPGVYRHIGMYAYRKDFLRKFCAEPPALIEREESLEQLRALYMGARIQVVMSKELSWGVDTPGDVEKIENILAGKK